MSPTSDRSTGSGYCQVITAIDSREAAEAMARAAVAARAAACGQVVGPITSVYWWHGKQEEAQEWQVVFKTTVAGYEALARLVREHHSYEVPEILCLPVLDGHRPYLDWIDAEVRVDD